MKLDRFKFAQLAAWIGKRCEDELTQEDIGHLDYLTETPDTVENARISFHELDGFCLAMFEGRKIDAIKLYRSMTGQGLALSKNAVESYWNPKENEPKLKDILGSN